MPYTDEKLPYSRAGTSKAAARSVRRTAPAIRERVLWQIRVAGGLTCYEIEVALGLSHQTASARVNDLARAGRIKDSGRRLTTISGRKAIVWEVSS